MKKLIEDYALIGDCRSAGLVGRDGSLDWLCFPRFDSPACFAALLGSPENGRWSLAPSDAVQKVERSYQGDTLVLETRYTTDSGEAAVVDCMTIKGVQPEVVRMVVGLRGSVRMRSLFAPRFDYGGALPWVRPESDGVLAVSGPDSLHLRAPTPLEIVDWSALAEFEVAEGERLPFVMTWRPSYLHPASAVDGVSAIEKTARWWQDWADKCTYKGEWRDAVVRSLLTLKALTYAPSGGVAAAATTSLPEWIGGERNWDYRYCWLRDATFTLSALLRTGYVQEARAWSDWLVRAVAGKGADVRIMYGVAGERRLPELELPWLSGYEGSSPVRIGNGAAGQLQLDVYGEVIDCLHLGRRRGIRPRDHEWEVERELIGHLESVYREPDQGVWEIRGGPRHFTHSKVMAWVAFDRAVKNVERFGLPGDAERWARRRDDLHAEICARAFDPDQNAFVQSYESRHLDAGVLVIPLVGFLPPTDPRVVGTVAAVERGLMHDGFVCRYRTETGVDGLPRGEGSFLLCTFWLADNYALMGRREDARRLFEKLLAIRNDVGLLSEEYDPAAGRLLGNFPQAFSHLSLVNTAHYLTRPEESADDRRSS